MGRFGFGLMLGIVAVLALPVDAVLNMAAKSGGGKGDSPFLVGQMLLWRKVLISPVSPPKAKLPPIPNSSQENNEESHLEPLLKSQPFVPHVTYNDVANAQDLQPSAPDYYDAIREEDQRIRMAAAVAAAAEPVQHRAHSSLTFRPTDHPKYQEHAEAIFEPKSMFVNPVNSELIVAAMAPNSHGGFMSPDEVVDSSKTTETHDSTSQMARFSDAPATSSVFFVVDGETGGSVVPIAHVAENSDVNTPAHPSDKIFVPIKTSDYENQMREKEMVGIKYLVQKRIKPSRDVILSKVPIELGNFPVFAVDAITNVEDMTDQQNVDAETQPSWMVPTDDLPSASSGEKPPPQDLPANSTTAPETMQKIDSEFEYSNYPGSQENR